MVLVSIIMPSYNHEKYISFAIESVLNQTFRDFELIILDDCSKDNSKEIIVTFMKNDNRIRAFFHEKNLGIAKTLNQGLKEATGTFIAFLASDDVWIESKLERQLNSLRNSEDALVWSEGEIIDEHSKPIGVFFTELYEVSEEKLSGNIFDQLLLGNFVFGSSLILKKDNIGEIKYDEQLKYLNDFRFIIDLAWKYKSLFDNKPLAKYRIHGKNAILSNIGVWNYEDILVREQILRDYGKLISNKSKSSILTKMGRSYLKLDKTASGKILLFKALIMYPPNLSNFLYFVIALVGSRSIVCRFLKIRLNKPKVY
jgi:glycosyltransferase involved in cell wall biosynthesis